MQNVCDERKRFLTLKPGVNILKLFEIESFLMLKPGVNVIKLFSFVTDDEAQ